MYNKIRGIAIQTGILEVISKVKSKKNFKYYKIDKKRRIKMGLKIAKIVFDTTKSLMSNPLAKTVGAAAIFTAGVLVGNQVGLDSFTKNQQSEVVDSTYTTQKNDTVKNTNTVATLKPAEEKQKTEEEISNRRNQLKKEIEALDKLPIQNLKEKTKFYSNSYGDSEYMQAGKYTVKEGTVNYKGKTLTVEINSYGDKKFFDNNGQLVYSFSGDSFSKYAWFEARKYDENNCLIEILGSHDYKDKNTILKQETNYKENFIQLNKYTQIEYDNARKERGYAAITDDNGHFVKGVTIYKGYNDINIKNGKIVDINGFKMLYDNKGRLIKNEFNDETYKYDARGNIKEVAQGYSDDIIIKYTFEYDEQNNLIDVKTNEIAR